MSLSQSSVRRAMQLSVKGTEDGNYCLVSFHEEDSMAVVPFKKIMHVSEVQLKEGDVVNVLWNDKRQYPATFLMKGSKFACEEKQTALEEEEEEEKTIDEKTMVDEHTSVEDKENVLPESIETEKAPRKRKRKLLKSTNETPNVKKVKKENSKNKQEKRQVSKGTKESNQEDDFIVLVGDVPPRQSHEDNSETKDAGHDNLSTNEIVIPVNLDDSGDKEKSPFHEFKDEMDEDINNEVVRLRSLVKLQADQIILSQRQHDLQCQGLRNEMRLLKSQLQFSTVNRDIPSPFLPMNLQSSTNQEFSSYPFPIGLGGYSCPPSMSEHFSLPPLIDSSLPMYPRLSHPQSESYSASSISHTLPMTQEVLPTSPAATLSVTSDLSLSPPEISTPPASQVINKTKVVVTTTPTVPSCSSPTEKDAELLTSGEITQIFIKSCSRKNFASLLVRRLFPEEIRKISNMTGKDKLQLDPEIINYVKTVTFQHWPLAQSEKFDREWRECKEAIDEANRRLNRPSIKKKRSL